MPRPVVEIPTSPLDPFPLYISPSAIVPGFGRGSKELGFPTANINPSSEEIKELSTGVYFGWARLAVPNNKAETHTENRVDGKTSVEVNYGTKLSSDDVHVIYPMVMNIGYSPFYHNKEKTYEVYIIHDFSKGNKNGDDTGFYGAELEIVICGYLRPELNYEGIDALKKDIQLDVDIGLENLDLESYLRCKELFP